ncbi:FAD binding domain-containing protein [Talaromyces proteolyticus]|uniref:FAD binding domain-containing protein n=1 Tax=Talaromyces proteolyticus TaxID=1131652 RepID=A0AAD4L2V0_9EURO|nr:FAD binding domain-containing protein [Talaromyces proteolyticus]KAH8703569.1 FAD binding domain-containing protein [Talaromyces proteolyticus]
MSIPSLVDILVVGSGNAGFSAAISAAQTSPSSRIILIDKCPESWAGGNSYFTAGAMRTAHTGLSNILPLVNNVDNKLAKIIDLPPYKMTDFEKDIQRICAGRSDPQLSKILIEDSRETIQWLKDIGVRFQLSFNRQAFLVDGRYKFWGGLALKTQDGGKGLIEDHKKAAQKHGVGVYYQTAAKELHTDPQTGAITGITVVLNGKSKLIQTKAVILAAGGFESNSRMRAQYLGRGWDLAYVRGTPFNTGDCLEMAVRDVSAKQVGNWSGCHATCWDANADPNTGNREISNEFTKSGYPLGVMINTQGNRFVDEGIDYRNYTYAIFGRAILQQPDGIAFQVWDSQMIPWLRSEEYRDGVVKKIHGDTIEELAEKCASEGLKGKEQFVKTLKEYNQAVYEHRKENPRAKWDPAIKDELSTQSSSTGLSLAKSNWATSIDQGPFMAVKVTGGITFTFGGLGVNPETAAVVSSTTNAEVPGLYSVGEMLGGLFYGNYPGGSGLTSGAVFGRRAGRAAAASITRLQARL